LEKEAMKPAVFQLPITRRQALGIGLGTAGIYGSNWLQALAEQTSQNSQRRRSCILLWMTGGPSQIDTFDCKPGHPNGGPVKATATSVPGITVSEYLPQIAKQTNHLAIVRSMSTKEGDHSRATYLLRTGYLPQGPIHYPTLGSLLSKQLGHGDAELPNYVSIAPQSYISPAAFEPGFLGPDFAPLTVGTDGAGPSQGKGEFDYAKSLGVKNLALPGGVSQPQTDARLNLLADLEREFRDRRGGASASSHQSAYDRAVRMMRGATAQAFDLSSEPAQIRDAYGKTLFGQGCLLARRLVERGVPFVEVSLAHAPGMQTFGWDTHIDNFNGVKKLCDVLDPAWAMLLEDLKQRGLLDSTLVVWMGEFGRTPAINGRTGRDHFPAAWSTVLSGGGIRGGQVVGRTSSDGMKVEDRPVAVSDLVATIALALGVDPMVQNQSDVGRPIRLADPNAKPLREIL
jgi:uncharacterized protein (DUF1501 family)